MQRQLWDTKRVILVSASLITHGVRRFGDSPRNSSRDRVFPLHLHGGMARAVEQGAGVGTHPDRRHQVLEHRSGPREQDWTSKRCNVGSGQKEPRFLWDLIFGDGNERGSASFGGQEVITR